MTKVDNNVCLIVIDGWGLSEEKNGNAILNAETPIMDKLCSGNWIQLEAHGLHVGVPEGQMGNSEVGHLNIGAGRVINQDIVRINTSIKNGTLVNNPTLTKACERAIKTSNGRIHLCGLVSDGGVHSHIDHLFGLAKAIKALNVPKLFIQFFGDGRDTSPTSGVAFLERLINFCNEEKYGELSTIVGRYYAMDRDKRWDRIRVAYDALISGKGDNLDKNNVPYKILNAVEIVKKRYENDETDEFLKPIVFSEESRVKDNDTLLFFNFRSDRMREITECFGMQRYKNLASDVPHPKNLSVVGMTQYNIEFPFPMLFSPINNKNVLAEWLSTKGLTQFHCAETEKYAHVTFFFNGGCEASFNGEERCMVPSPKVGHYNNQPEMSANEVANEMIEQIQAKKHRFIMCNFAPPDMVGHTGDYAATIKACQATDTEIGRIFKACQENNYILMVTSDHGNAEKMIEEDGSKFTAHTCNKVPFTCSSFSYKFKNITNRAPALCDVAPTVLDILGLDIPGEMDGVSLVEKQN